MESSFFYCYSGRLMYFLKCHGLKYIFSSKHRSTGKIYYAFPKSKELDDLIQLWNITKPE